MVFTRKTSPQWLVDTSTKANFVALQKCLRIPVLTYKTIEISYGFRSNGVGFGSFVSRIGGIAAPYVIDLQDIFIWLPNTIFGILSNFYLKKKL